MSNLRQRQSLEVPLLRLALLAMVLLVAAPSMASAEGPGAYMKRVTNELLAASRGGGAAGFATVLRSHGDIPAIGLGALGSYASSLPTSDRPAYFNGMVNWISRYVASEAPKYPVAKVVITGQTKETAGGAFVDSQITLKNGTRCDVRWTVRRRGGAWKVRGAEITCDLMPFPVEATDMLGKVFQDYIADNGNNPRKLVVALNQ